jgi:ATP-dependent DNA ligase
MLSSILYAKDANGKLRQWEIAADIGVLYISWGELNGALQYRIEYIEVNQSGRSLAEQTELEFNSRVKRQRDKGYVDTMEAALAGRTNTLDLPRPMLAKDSAKVRNIPYGCMYIQRKYDGNRCLIACKDGEKLAYSRNGKLITTIGHILDKLDIPDGMVLDGELYCHGESLQTIVSWIKRLQHNTAKLEYHVYDFVSPLPYEQRLNELNCMPQLNVVPTFKIRGIDEARVWFKHFRKEGYEGAILRDPKCGYEDGKRSSGLLKMKDWQDREYRVVDVSTNQDGWGVLHMCAANGNMFKATAPGTHEEKIHVGSNPADYIGRSVTVEYAYLTADGIPFHPIAKAWR